MAVFEAKRPLFSLDVEFYLAFHAEGKKFLLENYSLLSIPE